MKKLYLREGDRITRYYEAWANGEVVFEHWGKLGSRGQHRRHPIVPELGEEGTIDRVLQSAVEAGYGPVELSSENILLVEYIVDGFGTSEDLEKRHELEDRLNETLGWTGLGHVDGGSIGSGTMEVCCMVVDFGVATKVIEKDLDGTKFGDYSQIRIE